MNKKTILCTGSGGFIFSNFIRYVLKNYKDYKVVSIDRCNHPNVLNTIYANKGHDFHIGDVSDEHFVDVVFNLTRPDFVIHGAAESFVDASISDPNRFVQSNVMGTQVIVNACLKYNCKLTYISTDEVYGQMGENDPSWDEEAPLNPRNPYSATKAAGEMLVRAAGETHGLNYNITRSCNNFGPRQPRRNFIPVIISNILEGKEVPVYGNGMQVRDWIFVQDNCSAILSVMENATNKETYNISSKYELRNIEIVNKICNILGQGHNLITHVKDRPGHDFRYSITNNKITRLGWKPSWAFQDALTFTVNWYVNNRWFIKM